jgi:hypothetical protein
MFVLVGVLVVIGVAVGAHWLFKERTPEEMRSAVEKVRAFRERNRSGRH